MCYNMVIYTMPSYVLAQFMPTVPSLFTYFTFSSCAKKNSWTFKAGLFQNTVQLCVSCSPLSLPAAALCSTIKN